MNTSSWKDDVMAGSDIMYEHLVKLSGSGAPLPSLDSMLEILESDLGLNPTRANFSIRAMEIRYEHELTNIGYLFKLKSDRRKK